jgi:hypothetical protein
MLFRLIVGEIYFGQRQDSSEGKERFFTVLGFGGGSETV